MLRGRLWVLLGENAKIEEAKCFAQQYPVNGLDTSLREVSGPHSASEEV